MRIYAQTRPGLVTEERSRSGESESGVDQVERQKGEERACNFGITRCQELGLKEKAQHKRITRKAHEPDQLTGFVEQIEKQQ